MACEVRRTAFQESVPFHEFLRDRSDEEPDYWISRHVAKAVGIPPSRVAAPATRTADQEPRPRDRPWSPSHDALANGAKYSAEEARAVLKRACLMRPNRASTPTTTRAHQREHGVPEERPSPAPVLRIQDLTFVDDDRKGVPVGELLRIRSDAVHNELCSELHTNREPGRTWWAVLSAATRAADSGETRAMVNLPHAPDPRAVLMLESQYIYVSMPRRTRHGLYSVVITFGRTM